MTRAMHSLEAFLLALCNRSMNGCILVSNERAISGGRGTDNTVSGGVRFKYLLLHPGDAFEPLVADARAIVLTGGTMEPVRTTHLCV